MLKIFVLLTAISIGLMTSSYVSALSPSREASVCINTPKEQRSEECVKMLAEFSKSLNTYNEAERAGKIWNYVTLAGLVVVPVAAIMSIFILFNKAKKREFLNKISSNLSGR
ncbi:MAG: hypothetical protein AB203_00295 [Parcubacteria bacterium C7867-008]|nr:MAG: hypothetical protein AB203_00295 [Parcubacteria bacterium C7867-008]